MNKHFKIRHNNSMKYQVHRNVSNYWQHNKCRTSCITLNKGALNWNNLKQNRIAL